MLIKRLSLVAMGVATGLSGYAQAESEADLADVEKIVVTGQKIARTIQDTKESVTVITGEALRQLPALEYKDVFDLTPNAFNIAGGESFGLRGISQNSASTGGGSGELGILYIDGVAYTGFATRFNSKDLWDLEQIEILRGPQSTNVGRNALVGAVVINTKRPEIGDNYGEVRFDIGNYDRRSANGMVNIAVSENSALRVSGQYWENRGFINNVTLNDDEFDARQNTNLRAQYKINLSEDLTANLLVGYVDTERGQDIYRSDLQPIDSFASTANLAAMENYEGTNAALTLDYRINDNWDLTSITSYLEGEYERFDDDDEGPDGGNAFRGRAADDENIIQEVRVNYTSDNLSGVIGAFYNRIDETNFTTGLAAVVPANIGVPPQLLPFYPEVVEVTINNPFMQDVTNTALFTEWEYQVNDRWTLNAGLRYDREEQDVTVNTANGLAPGSALPFPADAAALAEQLAPGSGPAVFGGVTQVNALLSSQLGETNFPEQNFDFNALLPQLGATYAIDDNRSVSAFYKEGYRAGGVFVNSVGRASTFDPETLDNYELAYRSIAADGSWVFNANVYFGDWTDQQVTICRPNNIFDCDIQNAGESEIYGFEMDGRYQVTEDFDIFASVGHAHTEFTDYISASDGDLSGNTFAFSPEWTAALGGRFYVTEKVYVSGNMNYQDSMYSDVQNNFELDSRVLVNLRAGYEGEQYTIDAYVTNLTDKFYTLVNSPGIDGRSSLTRGGAPREFGLIFSYRFY